MMMMMIVQSLNHCIILEFVVFYTNWTIQIHISNMRMLRKAWASIFKQHMSAINSEAAAPKYKILSTGNRTFVVVVLLLLL